MKSSLGKTLRKVRKGKQITIDSLADNLLSKSQISRFERGESEVSCIRLINILDKLNMTLDEFLVLHNNNYGKTRSFLNLVQTIRKEISLHNIDILKKMLTDDLNINAFEKTMIKSMIYCVDNSFRPSEEELISLTDYLFKVECWGYYEIILLANCAHTMNFNSFFLLTKEMVKNYIYSHSNKTNKILVMQLCLNCLISSIEKEKFLESEYLINEIKCLLDKELNFYERTVFLYITGYYEYKNNIDSGIRKMKEAIQIFDFLEQNDLKEYYLKHYTEKVQTVN
ncbi:helix-turn-helix domain-containing protein [Globicatella sp. PHS-GS-PNBC-21-1553]|uniref:helix-turn-helix domain-containing protein n=1 Tax=Globicatella sp. PHS-GS-PNBC-21-1553 TaxID=2885764 RepID=UPI00298F1232|nr:helix-turn-helix domain-containing protein [Globicatella sp. PHS-GS-PNBC-21-1553]WPC07829.1 helix-turn-helix domain-containing protein [Globicatella sp. PHS-GS-PNBC-21-1553]